MQTEILNVEMEFRNIRLYGECQSNPVIAASAPRNRKRNCRQQERDKESPTLLISLYHISNHNGKVELALYETTRATTKASRKTTKYQLLGASGYYYRNIHVGKLNTDKCKTNLQHLLVAGIDVIIIDVLLPYSIGFRELPVKICQYVFDAQWIYPSPCRTYIAPVPGEKMSESGPQTLQF
jgi:hypothetical protein